MMTPPTSFTLESLSILLCFIAISVVVTWIAYLQKYFSLPYKDIKGPPLSLIDLFMNFLLVILIHTTLAPLFIRFLLEHISLKDHQTLIFMIVHLGIFIFTGLALFILASFRDLRMIKRVWKDYSFPGRESIKQDLFIGFISIIVAMPVVITFGQFAELIREFFFGYSPIDQLAVKYLKEALASPISLVIALFSILIAAPFLEEYLFRGILQSSLRQKMGPTFSIILSSFFFALFHYSPLQQSINIPLIITLFTFALYMGFIYEKTRSLFSNIVLHVTFNSISVIRIIFIET